MVKKKILFLSLCSFVLGVLFLINSEINIVGAFIGVSKENYGSIIGFFFIILSAVLFFIGSSLLEKKIALTSAINKYPGLVDLAERAGKDQRIQKEINHLSSELKKGNFEAGLGHPGHISGTNIFYLRGRNGGRLYYHIKDKRYEIVGKSSKGRNQDQVIKKLKEFYH